MNCVGIEISKGKSIVAVMWPLGEMVIPPFEVGYTDAELCKLSRRLGDLSGETRVVMEATGNYHLPVASFLYDSGFYVSVVNAMLVHGYGNNSLRRVKTDKKDAIKLANYGLDHWLALPRYIPEDEVRLMLKTTYRQYQQYAKVQTMLWTSTLLPVGISVSCPRPILPSFWWIRRWLNSRPLLPPWPHSETKCGTLQHHCRSTPL